MKKSAAFALFLALCVFALSTAVAAQTRARRVGSNTGSTATQQQSNDQRASDDATNASTQTSRRPPVLGGAVASNDQSAGARPSASNDPVDVDESEVISVNTTLVTIPVSVTDRVGKYVPDLRKEDFRIYENGVEQQVAYFATVEKPFTVALLIDTSGSTRYRMEEMQDAAISFVDQLRPDDRVIVVSFDDEVRVLCEATNDRNALRSAIRRSQRGEGTRLYDAVDFIIHERLDHIEGRKAIVLFTDGVDTTSRRADYQSTVRDAEEADSLIYAVQYDTWSTQSGGGGYPYPGGGGGGGRRGGGGSRRDTDTIIDIIGGILGGSNNNGRGGGGNRGGGRGGGGGGANGCTGCTREEYERGDQYLGDLATASGARRYRADDNRDLSSTFALVAEELRRQYSLGYYPKQPASAGERRQIKVRTTRPDLAVQARDSYVFGSQNANNSQPTNGNQRRTRPTINSQPFVIAGGER
jgi:VWFA-related protein